MTNSRPPRFALWVSRRLGVDNEWLAGDLVEEFGHRRSHLWLWRQVIGAVLARPEPSPRSGPLNLACPRMVRPAGRRILRERPRIDLSGGPVPSVGGLTVVALVFHTAVVNPRFLWLPVVGLAVGILAGIALAVRRRREPYRTTTFPFSAALSGLR